MHLCYPLVYLLNHHNYYNNKYLSSVFSHACWHRGGANIHLHKYIDLLHDAWLDIGQAGGGGIHTHTITKAHAGTKLDIMHE